MGSSCIVLNHVLVVLCCVVLILKGAPQVQRADQPVRLGGLRGLQPELRSQDAQPARWTNTQATADCSAAAATEPFPGVKLFPAAKLFPSAAV